MSCNSNISSLLPTQAELAGVIDYFDAIYTQWSRPCTIYYNPTIIACDCVNSPTGGVVAAWISGGPINQINPSCPMCSGKGSVSQENFEPVKLILEFNPAKFDPIWKAQLTQLPKGMVQAKGFLSDFPKIAKCIYMKTDLQQYSDYKWARAQEPVSIEKIIQGRYFTSVWERV